MKAYTDIEQSKTLAEFLPPESADMMWEQHLTDKPYVTVKPWTTRGKSIGGHCRCCWSLAALLNVLNDDYYTTLYHDGVAWNITAIHHDNVKDKHNVYANTPIDACVKMILKLHELKML